MKGAALFSLPQWMDRGAVRAMRTAFGRSCSGLNHTLYSTHRRPLRDLLRHLLGKSLRGSTSSFGSRPSSWCNFLDGPEVISGGFGGLC